MITKRWIEGPTCSDGDWDKIEMILVTRGWTSLNRQLTRIRVAEEDGQLLGFFVFQLMPYAGPLWAAPSQRGTGLALELTEEMVQFLSEVEARGWIVVADSPHSAKLCEKFGMTKLESPVYVTR